jgi:hypothetical protein
MTKGGKVFKKGNVIRPLRIYLSVSCLSLDPSNP